MNKKNLANAQLLTGINSSVTTATVKSGQGSVLPAVPFFATLSPVGVLSTIDNSEIVEVTGKSTDTLTIVRAQRGTAAKSFAADALVVNGIYVEDLSEGTWGSITGTLSDQTDLSSALSGKANSTHTHVATTDLTATGTKSSATYLRGDNTWATPTDTTYTEISSAEITTGTASDLRAITGRRAQEIVTKAVAAAPQGDVTLAGTQTLTNKTLSTGSVIDANVTVTEVLKKVYPVGSVYIATVATNPSTLLGFGTWVAYGEGKVIVGKAASGTFATAGATGGAETANIAHVHSIAHTHAAADNTSGGSYNTIGNRSFNGDSGAMSANSTPSILQPYIVAYMWQRTA